MRKRQNAVNENSRSNRVSDKKLPPELLASRPGLESLGYKQPEPGIGRPPARYTTAVHEHIIRCIKEGAYPEVAAASAGITRAEFSDWMRQARSGNIHLAQLLIDIEKAEADLEIELVKSIKDEKSSYRDPKYLTDRRFAGRWSPKTISIVQNEMEEAVRKLESHFADRPELLDEILSVFAK